MKFLADITRTKTGLVGAVITTVTALVFIALFVAGPMGFDGGPYFGLINFIGIPVLFIFGLLLIPVGLWLDRRARRRAGQDPGPVDVNLSNASTRRNIRIFIVATIVNVVILLVAAFEGYHAMESNEFCGTACHKVMSPEFTAWKVSPHNSVDCVECHVGPGPTAFVKAKITGSWQLASVALNLYPRPIATPVHNMRAASETCENCHSRKNFVGDKLKIISHTQDDEKNTDLTTVLMLKVGGMKGDKMVGIHAHNDPRRVIKYRSDPRREAIYEIQAVEDGRVVQTWKGPDFEKPEARAATAWRTMDCMDCHNRPAHTFDTAEHALDVAFTDGRLDRELPFLRREGLKAVAAEYPTQEAARDGITAALNAFYGKQTPAVAPEKIAAASKTLGELYATNVFPQMNIKWGTYPNQISHAVVNGCLRCHNGDHKAADGEAVASDCDSCHSQLADGEENPDILKALRGE